MDDGDFSLHVACNGQGPIITLTGDLDITTAPILRDCLQDHLGDTVTLDFAGVTFMDSSALEVVLSAHKQTTADGGRVILSGMRPQQMRLFELLGLTDYVNLESDATGACPAAANPNELTHD